MERSGDFQTITLNGTSIPCKISRKSKNRITLRVSPEGIIRVSSPPGIELDTIRDIIFKRKKWILGKLELTNKHKADSAEKVLYHGRTYSIEVSETKQSKRVAILPDRGIIIINTYRTDESPALILIKKLRREAKRYLTERIRKISTAAGLPFQQVSVRDQKTRWGSSSGRGMISLNWRSIMMPEDVSDYLILHELAHQIHHNHSKEYWQFLGTLCPGYKEKDRYLQKHSYLLGFYRT